jgi:branched-chain amino acid transport system substrate-binding protein
MINQRQACTCAEASRRRRVVTTITTSLSVLVVAAVAAGCGGGSSSSSSSVGASLATASTAKKSPIKVMLIDDVTAATGLSFPAEAESGKATVDDINAHGGIEGHPIELTVCDSKLDPNQTETCARQAVQSNVVAVVGSFTQNDGRMLPVLTAAKIPYIPGFAYDPSEFSSSVSFPINSAIAFAPGEGMLAGKYCKSSVIVIPESATSQFSVSLTNTGLKAAGKPPAKVITISQQPGDYSAQVAEAMGTGAQCVISEMGEANAAVFYPAMQQAGDKQRIVGFQGNSITPELVAKAPAVMEGALNVDFFPAYSGPQWDPYRAIVAKYSDPKKYDFSLAGAQLAHLSFLTFQRVATQVVQSGQTVSASTILAQLNKATNVDLNGLLPPLNFSRPAPVKGFPRMFNPDVTFEVVKNGKIVPLDGNQFHDMTSVLQSVLGTA